MAQIPTTNFGLSSHIQGEFGGTNPTSLTEYYRGGTTGYVPNSLGNIGFGLIAQSGAIAMGTFRNQQKVIAGNSGIISTAGSGTFTLPSTSGATITIQVIGGGGGGGSSSDRYATSSPASFRGGAGGGGGGALYTTTLTVTPGATISYFVGAGGAGGLGFDSGSNGPTAAHASGAGQNSYAVYNAAVVVQANGGAGGAIANNFWGSWVDGRYMYTGGALGAAGGTGTAESVNRHGGAGWFFVCNACGLNAYGKSGNNLVQQEGGAGAQGIDFSNVVGATGLGSIGGAGGPIFQGGAYPSPWPPGGTQYQPAGIAPGGNNPAGRGTRAPTTGSGYGAGGGGGSSNATAAQRVTFPWAYTGAPGASGAVLISWG